MIILSEYNNRDMRDQCESYIAKLYSPATGDLVIAEVWPTEGDCQQWATRYYPNLKAEIYVA